MVEHSKETTLLEWESPERVYTTRSRTYFRNLFTLLAILAGVAVFFKEFLLVGVLGALGFVKWALGTNPPKISKHIITNLGIKTHGHEYGWDQLKDFWFGEISGQSVLHIDTKSLYPGRLYLLMGRVSKGDISEVLSKHLSFLRKPKKDPLEKIFSRVSSRFPLE
jgi:hypothetical protein